MAREKIGAERVARLTNRHFEDAIDFMAGANHKALRGAEAWSSDTREQCVPRYRNFWRIGQPTNGRQSKCQRVVNAAEISSAPGELREIATGFVSSSNVAKRPP